MCVTWLDLEKIPRFLLVLRGGATVICRIAKAERDRYQIMSREAAQQERVSRQNTPGNRCIHQTCPDGERDLARLTCEESSRNVFDTHVVVFGNTVVLQVVILYVP